MDSVLGLLAIEWAKIRRDGALNKLSTKLTVLLMERSFFDIFCDIWFLNFIFYRYFQIMGRTLKAMIIPFFVKSDP